MSKQVTEEAPIRRDGSTEHWSPWTEVANLRRGVDDLLRRNFPFGASVGPMSPDRIDFEPALDLFETGDTIELFAGVPGFKPEEITVEASGETITLSGNHQAIYNNDMAVSHQASGVTESAKFRLTYTLPAEINPNKVHATFADGVLRLEMPKAEHARTKAVKVHVTTG